MCYTATMLILGTLLFCLNIIFIPWVLVISAQSPVANVLYGDYVNFKNFAFFIYIIFMSVLNFIILLYYCAIYVF
jgi:hypothetical protein